MWDVEVEIALLKPLLALRVSGSKAARIEESSELPATERRGNFVCSRVGSVVRCCLVERENSLSE